MPAATNSVTRGHRMYEAAQTAVQQAAVISSGFGDRYRIWTGRAVGASCIAGSVSCDATDYEAGAATAALCSSIHRISLARISRPCSM